MSQELIYTPLLIILGLAFVIPFIASRIPKIRMPIIVGEILVGIIIGKSGLNIIQESPWLTFLSVFGFVYLMFLSGLEIDLSKLGNPPRAQNRKLTRDPLFLGLEVFFITLILSYFVAIVLAEYGLVNNAIFMALILSTTSVAVVVPTLREMGITNTPYGQTMLMAALTADFSTMLLITVLVSLVTSGLTPDVLLISVLFVAFLVIYEMGHVLFKSPSRVEKLLKSVAPTAEVGIRGVFFIMMLFVVLSQMIGTEVILGAFLAGVLVSLFLGTTIKTHIRETVHAMGFGFLIPIFFIMVGVNFQLGALLESSIALMLVPVLVFSAYFVKMVPSILFKKLYSPHSSYWGGVLLSSRLSLIIAAGAIGFEVGMISQAVNSAIILVAVITSTISPILFSGKLDREKIFPLG